MQQDNNKEQEQTKGAQQGNIDQDRDMGNKSQSGTTSTDPEKSRLQTVENNEIGGEEGNSATTTRDTEDKGVNSTDNKKDPQDDNPKAEGVSNTSDVDAGYTRTSAFDGTRNPRDSGSNTEGKNEVSNEHEADILRTTDYGPDVQGGDTRQEGRIGTPRGEYRTPDNTGRMHDL